MLIGIAVSGNYVGELLGCKLQYLLTNNIYAKHITLIVIIYFTLTVLQTGANHPLQDLKFTIYLWFGYLLFAHTHIVMTLIIFSLIVCTYVLSNYMNYLEQNNKSRKEIDRFKRIRDSLFVSIIAITILSSIYYMYDKYAEYSVKFTFLEFFFMKKTCKSLEGNFDY